MAYPVVNKPTTPTTGIPMATTPKSNGGSWFRSLITLIIVVAIIGGGVYYVTGFEGLPLISTSQFSTEWQAVFLSNGQVYFGKVDKVTPDFLTLTDIYYLQVVSQQNTIGQPQDVQQQPEQRLTLIKLGNEIHGPTDTMHINRDHVMMVEELKNDSRVVQAINDYLTKGTAAPAPAN